MFLGPGNWMGVTMFSGTPTPEAPELDADALDWQTRVSESGSASSATVQAISDFCVACKAAGIWDKLLRVNLFCGDNFYACTVPLKTGPGASRDILFNFVAGDYSEGTGVQGDGVSKYLSTGLFPSASMTTGDTHVSLYNRSSGFGVGSMGCTDGGNQFAFFPPWDVNVSSWMYDESTTVVTGTSSFDEPHGFLLASRTNSADHRAYRNGTQLSINTASIGSGLPGYPFHLFAVMNNGTPSWFSVYQAAGYTMGAGLFPSEVAALNSAMQAFQMALGRKV